MEKDKSTKVDGSLNFIEQYGLSPEIIEDIKRLVEECNKVENLDYNNLLSFPTLYNRPNNEINDLTVYKDDKLIGFIGLYSFVKKDEVEIFGMVHPEYRQQKIFTRLFQKARHICTAKGIKRALLVVEQLSPRGKAFVANVSGKYSFTEYKMRHERAGTESNDLKEIGLRRVNETDIPDIVQIGVLSFGSTEQEEQEFLFQNINDPDVEVYAAFLGKKPIGIIRVRLEKDTAFIFGFAVQPEFQGRGYGKHILKETINNLRRRQITEIVLEVATENYNALSLYKNCGFQITTAFDYFDVNES